MRQTISNSPIKSNRASLIFQKNLALKMKTLQNLFTKALWQSVSQTSRLKFFVGPKFNRLSLCMLRICHDESSTCIFLKKFPVMSPIMMLKTAQLLRLAAPNPGLTTMKRATLFKTLVITIT